MALMELIEEKTIRIPLLSTGKEAIIRELVGVLAAAGKVRDEEETVRAVLARESLGSTGLADGIAIPHGKTVAVKALTLAIGVSARGVDFEALDGKPSQLFFLILAPPDQSGPHIQALAEIARIARSKAFCRAIVGAKDAAEIVELFAI